MDREQHDVHLHPLLKKGDIFFDERRQKKVEIKISFCMNKNLQYLCRPLLEKAIKEALWSRIEIKFFDLMQQPKSYLYAKIGPPQTLF